MKVKNIPGFYASPGKLHSRWNMNEVVPGNPEPHNRVAQPSILEVQKSIDVENQCVVKLRCLFSMLRGWRGWQPTKKNT